MSEHLISIDDARGNLLALAARLAEDVKSADGHADALKRIVPIYVEKGEVDLAAELSDSIADPFARDRLLTLVAEKCAVANDVEYAFQLAEAIEDVGIAAEARERIAVCQVASGDFEKALATAETLDHPDNVFSEMALRFDAEGNAERRDEMIDAMKFPTAKAVALGTLAGQYLQKDDKKSAVEFLDRAAIVAGTIDYETDEIRLLTDIGNLFSDANRKDRAIETLDKARQVVEKMDSVHREYLLSAVSLGFFNAGSIDLADRTLDLITDKTHLSATLLGFARGYWERDERIDALDALEEAYQILQSQLETETRDSRAKFQLWRSVATQFAGFEKYERAIEAAQFLPDDSEQMDALGEIAQIATLHGQDDFADQALRAIADDAKRMTTLVGMSDAKQRRGDSDAALQLLGSAAELAETVPQLALRSGAYNELAKRFAAHGETDKAREISHLNLETILAIKDDSVRAIAFADLSQIYELMGFELNDTEKETLRALIQKTEW
ncbi:MAG: hypothetical protein IPN69_19720 [Acidobacteria bacterium]|nr:hypothetical protein [Acidobacteriota bacterium]MBK8812939.1 hypothetical protein [Acidobacteriota bacterium]